MSWRQKLHLYSFIYFSSAWCLIDAQLMFSKWMNILRGRQEKETEMLKGQKKNQESKESANPRGFKKQPVRTEEGPWVWQRVCVWRGQSQRGWGNLLRMATAHQARKARRGFAVGGPPSSLVVATIPSERNTLTFPAIRALSSKPAFFTWTCSTESPGSTSVHFLFLPSKMSLSGSLAHWFSNCFFWSPQLSYKVPWRRTLSYSFLSLSELYRLHVGISQILKTAKGEG